MGNVTCTDHTGNAPGYTKWLSLFAQIIQEISIEIINAYSYLHIIIQEISLDIHIGYRYSHRSSWKTSLDIPDEDRYSRTSPREFPGVPARPGESARGFPEPTSPTCQRGERGERKGGKGGEGGNHSKLESNRRRKPHATRLLIIMSDLIFSNR